MESELEEEDEERGGDVVTGGRRVLGAGERDLRSVACCGRGLVWVGRFRDVVVVFADEVRENGGARGRPEVDDSFFGRGESFREDRADGTRGPGTSLALLVAMTTGRLTSTS